MITDTATDVAVRIAEALERIAAQLEAREERANPDLFPMRPERGHRSGGQTTGSQGRNPSAHAGSRQPLEELVQGLKPRSGLWGAIQPNSRVQTRADRSKP